MGSFPVTDGDEGVELAMVVRGGGSPLERRPEDRSPPFTSPRATEHNRPVVRLRWTDRDLEATTRAAD